MDGVDNLVHELFELVYELYGPAATPAQMAAVAEEYVPGFDVEAALPGFKDGG